MGQPGRTRTNTRTHTVCVGVWACGCVGVWVCGCVGVWVCVCVGVWVCGCVGVCVCVCGVFLASNLFALNCLFFQRRHLFLGFLCRTIQHLFAHTLFGPLGLGLSPR